MVNIYNKNLKFNAFTHYNLISLLFCIFNNNYINYYAITTCWSWSIFITFYSAVIYDNNAYVRLRKKINTNFMEFHFANFALHGIPCVYIYFYPPNNINYYHSLISMFLKYFWIYISTNKTMNLSNIYIKFSDKNIKRLYLTSVLSSLIVPTYYKIT